MLFTAGVSSNLLESSTLVGRRVEWMVVFNGTYIFAFPAFGRTPGRGRLEGGICEMRLSPR
jgi:hypothetical protein